MIDKAKRGNLCKLTTIYSCCKSCSGLFQLSYSLARIALRKQQETKQWTNLRNQGKALLGRTRVITKPRDGNLRRESSIYQSNSMDQLGRRRNIIFTSPDSRAAPENRGSLRQESSINQTNLRIQTSMYINIYICHISTSLEKATNHGSLRQENPISRNSLTNEVSVEQIDVSDDGQPIAGSALEFRGTGPRPLN